VGLVQANIPQDEKWAEAKAVANLAKLRRMSVSLQETPLDLIVWPEAAFPWPVSTEATGIDPGVLGFDANAVGALPHLLLGALSERPDGEFYNSALLFDGRGRIVGRYHKAHLVPFGEYVPYRKLLTFAHKLTEPVGNFLEGTSFEPLRMGTARIGVLICYEDVFPEVARKIAAAGAELFVNMTNDAWYGVSSAPWQHLGLSVFRAVENRRSIVRATNTGISAVVAPSGRVLMETGLDEDAIIVAAVGLRRDVTPYTRLGDWFAWGCIAYAALGMAFVLVRRLRAKG
jgi:apolipoprotein N-acyltransferase